MIHASFGSGLRRFDMNSAKTDKEISPESVKAEMLKKGIPPEVMAGDLTGKELEAKISEHLRKEALSRKKK